jgi:hypothetical protein
MVSGYIDSGFAVKGILPRHNLCRSLPLWQATTPGAFAGLSALLWAAQRTIQGRDLQLNRNFCLKMNIL